MGAKIDLQSYFPYRMAVLAQHMSLAVAEVYSKRFALSRQEWRVIAVIGGVESIPTRDIGRITTLDKMEISRAMQKLERRGFVARVTDESDRRNKIVALTPSGRALYEDIVPLALQREVELLADFTEAERETFETLMRKLTATARRLQE
jgi:DNA-binding MarR family transcriptional regulator